MNEYLYVLRNWNNFEGRSSRREFWMFVLFNVIFAFIARFLDRMCGTLYLFAGLYNLFILLPSIAVSIRRMHDIGKSGWWLLINLLLLIGNIWFFILALMPGQPEENEYGENPQNL